MIHDRFPTVGLHNVVETEPAGWTGIGGRGYCLRRVPRSVGTELNVGARERVRHPAGSEVRFVPETNESTVSVTLSARTPTVVRPFWGVFQGRTAHQLGPEPTTLELSVPENLGDIAPDAVSAPFDARVCRLRFEMDTPVALHAIDGACRPPEDDEVPARRYLAYGTSITEGAAASGAHLTYVSRVARRLGVDAINLGTSGSAFCDPSIAEYLAGRDDWDVATLALSVNMANRGFTVEQFRTRAEALVRTVTDAHPDRPVVCVSLFPYYDDVCLGGDRARATAFRDELRAIVRAVDAPRLSLVDGYEAMDATGLTTDVLHPGDAGMESIAATLATALDGVAR